MIEQSSKLFANKDAFRVKTKDNSYRGITFAEFKNDIDAFGTACLICWEQKKDLSLL